MHNEITKEMIAELEMPIKMLILNTAEEMRLMVTPEQYSNLIKAIPRIDYEYDAWKFGRILTGEDTEDTPVLPQVSELTASVVVDHDIEEPVLIMNASHFYKFKEKRLKANEHEKWKFNKIMEAITNE